MAALPLVLALPLRTRSRCQRRCAVAAAWLASRARPALVALRPARSPAVATCLLLSRRIDADYPRLPNASTRPRPPLAAGAWLAASAVLGPFTSPLPMPWSSAALLLAVPWWAHRRRRAKVRVERTLAAWPDIAEAVGLAGSQVMSAVVDLWGWRARLALARGQTIDDVIARMPAIESGARHVPRSGPRLPDPRRPGQPVRVARAGHRPARRRDHLARTVRLVHHQADRPRPLRGRRTVPRSCSCAATRSSAAEPDQARAAG